MSTDTAIVVLAGGDGSRIGGSKPLRRLAGERLIDRALRLALGWSDTVAIALRDPAQARDVDARFLIDVPRVEGPLAGLITAMEYARDSDTPFVLTIPADMPFLPTDLLQRLRSAIGASACAMARSGGHFHPVCGLWAVSALDSLDLYLETGRRSLKGFAETVGFVAVEWRIERSDPFFNVNDRADLHAAERLVTN
ncbi:MAG TPA: molybdenum cofactor guanylyltransferase [Sphingomicrobium sp.]|jgi:molybdopterin-guanine dinucleotide biosynthesis protein A|nr:molybdenum cofactor guanylyltransferase [Sphingomicrobium sp.]